MWRNTPGSPPSAFCSSKTWDILHLSPPAVQWHEAIWFKGNIPKHSFIAWVLALNRMPMWDRLQNWSMNVPTTCLLCASTNETRDHIFFTCQYSMEFCTAIFAYSGLAPPSAFEDVLLWTKTCSTNQRIKTICKFLWKERNTRYYISMSRPVSLIKKDLFLLWGQIMFLIRWKIGYCNRITHSLLVPLFLILA